MENSTHSKKPVADSKNDSANPVKNHNSANNHDSAKNHSNLTIEEFATFCKRKGFVYSSSEIYGGIAGFFDYGPYGVEVKNNIKKEWWRYHVWARNDMIGMDGSIITHPRVWVASGHVACFKDLMLVCKDEKCGNKMRADVFIEEHLNVQADGMKADQINHLVKENDLKCNKCRSEFEEVSDFNLMFETRVGPSAKTPLIAYLRPETAQTMFADFKLVTDNARMKLPFGIAQMGKAFRNEISPRDFLFRCREFEQMEIEYFIHPDHYKCPYIDEVLDYELIVYSAKMQEEDALSKKPREGQKMTMKQALANKIILTEWHAYWLSTEHKFFVSLGAKGDLLRVRQHLSTEKSHYALDTWDFDHKFPFGWKELQGLANRTDFDLKAHMKESGKDLSVHDEATGKKVIPHVVCEPSLGLDRTFLVFMMDAYTYDSKRENVVLKLHPRLAAIKAAVFPLLSNREELMTLAREVHGLLKNDMNTTFDKSGSVGRRYSRQDELGTPFCITVDFDSLEKKDVTIRDRDTAEQKRVPITNLRNIIRALIDGEMKFEEL